MKIKLEVRSKGLLIGISSIGLSLSGFVDQGFGASYAQVKHWADDNTHVQKTDIDQIITFVSRIISSASSRERESILINLRNVMSHTPYSGYVEDLKDYLYRVAFNHYIEKYSSLSYTSDVKNDFRRSRIRLILEYIRKHFYDQEQYAEIRQQLIWLFCAAFSGDYNFDSVTTILESVLTFESKHFPEACRIPEQNAHFFNLNTSPFKAPKDTIIAHFISLIQDINSESPEYNNWIFLNSVNFDNAIKNGEYPEIVAQIAGYILFLNPEMIEHVKMIQGKHEWFWNKDQVRAEKKEMWDSLKRQHNDNNNT